MKKNEEAMSTRKPQLVRGKWANLLEKGSNVAVLELDLVDHFPDSASVNRALRVYLKMKEQFAAVESSSKEALGGRTSPLPFDPRNGQRSEAIVAAK